MTRIFLLPHHVLVINKDRTVYIWRVEGKKLIVSFKLNSDPWFVTGAEDSNGNISHILCSSVDGKIYIWNLLSQPVSATIWEVGTKWYFKQTLLYIKNDLVIYSSKGYPQTLFFQKLSALSPHQIQVLTGNGEILCFEEYENLLYAGRE